MDAAYVAERVLTLDELKAYVDRNWSKSDSSSQTQYDNDYDYAWQRGAIAPGQQLRYLLARRLARAERYAQARKYFPVHWQAQLDLFTNKLSDSRNEKFSGPQRAFAMFDASRMMRTNGMKLFGTELQPDWFIEDGNFEAGVTWQERAKNQPSAKINLANDEEIGRAVCQGVEPDCRWHYRELSWRLRCRAADLAWEAAQSMPDNSDETARFLCTAGTWLKKRDPEAADKFYKALVCRCRKTAIGDLADKIRWFPLLDENGNLRPWPPPRKFYGGKYIVRFGDTAVNITLDAGISLKALREANAGVDLTQLRIGQVLEIPAPDSKIISTEAQAAPN
jgi:hypothetical protein